MCERAKEMYHSHQTNTHTHTCKCSRLICLNQSDRTNDRAHWVCAWKRHSLGVYSHFDIDVYGVVESWCCSIHKCTSYTHSHSYSHISPPVYTINFACESTTCVNVCVLHIPNKSSKTSRFFSIFRMHRVSEWEWKTLCQLYGYGVPAIVQHFAVWHTFYHSFVRSFVRFDRSNGIKSRKISNASIEMQRVFHTF